MLEGEPKMSQQENAWNRLEEIAKEISDLEERSKVIEGMIYGSRNSSEKLDLQNQLNSIQVELSRKKHEYSQLDKEYNGLEARNS